MRFVFLCSCPCIVIASIFHTSFLLLSPLLLHRCRSRLTVALRVSTETVRFFMLSCVITNPSSRRLSSNTCFLRSWHCNPNEGEAMLPRETATDFTKSLDNSTIFALCASEGKARSGQRTMLATWGLQCPSFPQPVRVLYHVPLVANSESPCHSQTIFGLLGSGHAVCCSSWQHFPLNKSLLL